MTAILIPMINSKILLKGFIYNKPCLLKLIPEKSFVGCAASDNVGK
ncbi:MAG: hypothetical protein PHY66_12795 [Aliarcobacter sp.]|nr:hypothetical protein [Aliarcobacter sp.]